MSDNTNADQCEPEAGDEAGDAPIGYQTPLTLKEYVILVGDALPVDFMSEFIAAAEASEDWLPAGVGSNADVRSDVRNCDYINLSKAGDWAPKYHQAMARLADQCHKLYLQKFPRLQVDRGAEIQLLRYQAGGFYKEHVDRFPNAPRTLTMTFLLNDAFEGGEMTLFEGRLKLSMKAGEVVMFPAGFMFPHSILPVHAGVRYAVVTWLY